MEASGYVSSATINNQAVAIPTGTLTIAATEAGNFTADGYVEGPGGSDTCSVSYSVVTFGIGDMVDTIEAADLYVGSDVVGHVDAGQKFQIVRLQDGWAWLKQTDGTELKGWIQTSELKPAT